MFKMTKLILLIVLALPALVQSGSPSDVCGARGLFGPPAEVRNLLEAAKSNTQICPQEHQNAVVELEKILSNEQLLKDVCSRTSYQTIRDFHARFVVGDKLEPAPKSVRNYFISFASDIALLCTRQLIGRFDNELKDFSFQLRELEEFKKVKSLARQHLKTEVKNTDPKHINELVIRDEHSPTVHLIVGKGSEISRVLQGCEVRYDLASEELFAPVARLNKLGYGVGLLSMQETMSLLSHKYVPWLSAIDVCETLKDLDTIMDHRRTDVSLASDEQASSLKAELLSLPQEHQIDFNSVLPLDLEHEPVQFKQLTDQKGLRNVVAKFESEVARLSGQHGGVSLYDAFSVYGQTTQFTTEKPESGLGKVLSNFGF